MAWADWAASSRQRGTFAVCRSVRWGYAKCMEVGELFFIMLAIQHLVQKLHTGPQDKAKPVSLSGNIGLQDAPSWLGGYSSLKAGRASISPKDQKEVSLLLNLPVSCISIVQILMSHSCSFLERGSSIHSFFS